MFAARRVSLWEEHLERFIPWETLMFLAVRACISGTICAITISLCFASIFLARDVGNSERAAFSICGGLLVASGATCLCVLVDAPHDPNDESYRSKDLPLSVHCCVPSHFLGKYRDRCGSRYAVAAEAVSVVPLVLFASAAFWCGELHSASKTALVFAPVGLFLLLRETRIVPQRGGVAGIDSLLLVNLFYSMTCASHRGFYRDCPHVICRVARNPYGVSCALALWIATAASAFAAISDIARGMRRADRPGGGKNC
jgi:hypothetical protein